jgi:hypothetical protein
MGAGMAMMHVARAVTGRWISGGFAVRVAALISAALLCSCGAGAQDPVWQTVQQALSRASGTGLATETLPAQQDAIRHIVAAQRPAEPLLMMTLPDRGAVATLAVLEEFADSTKWADASGITVTLQDGVVVQTRGLGHDLMASDISGLRAALKGADPHPYTRVMRRLSATGVLLRGTASCRLKRGPDRIIEQCTGETRFENWYAMGAGAASRQWLGPSLGYLYIERLN